MQKTIWDKYAQVLVDYSVDAQKGELVIETLELAYKYFIANDSKN